MKKKTKKQKNNKFFTKISYLKIHSTHFITNWLIKTHSTDPKLDNFVNFGTFFLFNRPKQKIVTLNYLIVIRYKIRINKVRLF